MEECVCGVVGLSIIYVEVREELDLVSWDVDNAPAHGWNLLLSFLILGYWCMFLIVRWWVTGLLYAKVTAQMMGP